MPSVRVAALQLASPDGEPRDERIERVTHLVERAPAADLLVLPELWDVGYFAFDDYREAAAPLAETAAARLAPVVAARGATAVAGTFLERDDGRLHNTTVVLGPEGSTLGSYRKIHLFAHRSREAELVTPGDTVTAVDTPAGHLGLATCFDLRFPDHFAALRAAGADVIVVPAAWPAARADHWRTLLRARAIDTQTPIVGVNGTGPCASVPLAGGTAVIDAQGRALTPERPDEGWIVADLDPDATHRWRTEFPLPA